MILSGIADNETIFFSCLLVSSKLNEKLLNINFSTLMNFYPVVRLLIEIFT